MAKQTYDLQRKIVRLLAKANAKLLAGTDSLNPYVVPGFSLHDELGYLVAAGVSNAEALRAATLNPAKFLGRDKELGQIAKGKRADLVLLEANPLDDIANTKRIDTVIVRGRIIPRHEPKRY